MVVEQFPYNQQNFPFNQYQYNYPGNPNNNQQPYQGQFQYNNPSYPNPIPPNGYEQNFNANQYPYGQPYNPSAPYGGNQMGGQGFPQYEDPIDSDKLITEDLETSIRHAFIRKVYGILSIQFLVTIAIVAPFISFNGASKWLVRNAWIGLICMVVALVLIIVLSCVESVARAHPANMICLMILSGCFGIMIALSCVRLKTSTVFIALGITTAVTAAVTLFAFQTKYDFTGCGVFVFITAIVLTITGIVCIFVRNKILHIVYAAIGALLFSFYIIYDTQKIVGGKHRKYSFSIDEYVFASLALYLDIVNLFLFILSLVARVNE